MITTKFYLDARVEKPDNKYFIYVKITNNRNAIMYNTGVKTAKESWDGVSVTRTDANFRTKNIKIRSVIDTIDKIIYEINGSISNASLKKMIDRQLKGTGSGITFIEVMEEFIATKKKRTTSKVYISTRNKIASYEEDVTFDKITPEWLSNFENKLLNDGHKVNYISIQMRNIRAVFNFAIDKEYTTLYPFRKFKIKQEQTEKRSLTVEQVRELINYPCEEYQKKYRDLFILMIYMIGINSVDLFKLKPIKGDKISYIRQKTNKETATSVRRIEFTLQPEAEEIIQKYAGKNYMIDVMDVYKNHEDFIHRMNIGLQKIGNMERVGRGGKKIITPAFPGITSYWARHTWATLAAQLDIPKETIGAALGHAGTSVTDIYINFDKRKIDEANRKVIDFILKKN